MLTGLIIGVIITFGSLIAGLLNMKRMTCFDADIDAGFKGHIWAMIGMVVGMAMTTICGILYLVSFLSR